MEAIMSHSKHVIGVVLLGAILASWGRAQPFPLENVHSGVVGNIDDYLHLRGINYLAVYPGLHAPGGPLALGQPITPGGPVYEGIGSSSMMWLFYGHPIADPAALGGQTTTVHIDEQLLWMKRTGFNAIRVFVSFPYWQFCRLSTDPSLS